jgi:Phage stabilisation protein
MAFSNTPQFSTYKQETIEIDGTPLYRSGDVSAARDLQIINMFYDRISQENKTRETILKKRPGLAASSYSLTKSASSDVLRGSYYDVDQNAFYWAVGNKLYSVNPDVGTTVRTVATLNTSSGYVGFCSFLKSDNVRYVLATDGTDLWVDDYVAVSCTRVTDSDMPTPHEPFPIYLNGYVFLIESDSGHIWNSNNDDPTAWTAGEFITAEISSDYALRLVKAKNYLVCLGYSSIEYFWDAGNATGSPLSRNDSPVRAVGYISNLCTIGDITYFVGQDEKKNIGVFTLDSFKVERISNSVVERTLQTIATTANAKGQLSLEKDGFCISVDGHSFYVLRATQTTWVYDIEEKMWYEWKGSDNTGLKVEAVWGMYNGSVYLAMANQSSISLMSPSLYQDFDTNFTCQYTTEPLSFGTLNWKVANKLHIDSSQHASSGTSNVAVSWTNTDWADSVSSRNINVFSISPFINKLGRFRLRSFRFTYADNYPWFFKRAYLNLNVMGH